MPKSRPPYPAAFWSWPSSAHRLRLSLLPALSVRGRPPTGRPPPAGGNGSTTQDRGSISLPVAFFPAHRTPLVTKAARNR